MTEAKLAERLDVDDRLADGAIICTLSFQPTWIYARVASMTRPGTVTTRRYRWGQAVLIEAVEP